MINVNNATVTWPAQMMGRQDGADVVAKGEGKSFEEMNAWYEQVHL